MSSAWLLPEHIADVLPAQARRLEELRRICLDAARGYGYELVAPPLLEHLESLLSGTGHALDLNTFKLVDQLSGKTLGVRADTTPQVARIDAHLLNREGVSRLSYCGPVLHTKPASPHASREPLQLGAEIYGHAGLEADLEVAELALESLRSAGAENLLMDLADVRVMDGLLLALGLTDVTTADHLCLTHALCAKDVAAIQTLAEQAPFAHSSDFARVMTLLTTLYGDVSVLAQARAELPKHPMIYAALDNLAWLHGHLIQSDPTVQVSFDLSDLSGYAYYSGTRFAVYAAGFSDAILRGGRYDEVGAVFGRRRPAVGFSLDLKVLADILPLPPVARTAILAPWGEDVALRQTIRDLRLAGHTVVCALPGHEHDVQEFACDRQLVLKDGQWMVQAC